MSIVQHLHDAVAAVCPIEGVGIGRLDDRTTWRIDATANATREQCEAAIAALAAFDLMGAVKADALDDIDRQFARHASVDPGVARARDRKREDAEEFTALIRDGQTPNVGDFANLAATAAALGIAGEPLQAMQAAADMVIQAANDEDDRIAVLDLVRLQAKARVRAAATADDVRTVLASIRWTPT